MSELPARPGAGEIDVAAAPLPYADDRKRFEGALSRIPGVRGVRAVSTRGATHRVRVTYQGEVPFAERLRQMKDFRLRVVAQSASMVQVLVEAAR